MLTFKQILSMPFDGDQKRSEVAQALSDDLTTWAKDENLPIERMALLAAAAGALLGLRDIVRKQEEAPEAAGSADNLTSLDL